MPATLLIVDDERDIRDMLSSCFRRRGYQVLAAAGGQEAVALAARQPDLILLDVNMPDMDGLEVCRRIREDVSCPILFLTARVEDSDKIQGFAAGGDEYIVKPFSIEVLLAGKSIPSVNTTPESYDLQEYFARMAKAGIQVVVMEVSSQGLMLCRVGGFTFDYGIFTNLEPDHIGDHEHKDFEDYKRCKSLLFRQCRVGILNSDSPYFGEMLKNAVCKVETFGYGEEAGLRASAATLLRLPGMVGVRFHVSGPVDMDVTVNVPGKFSVYNALAAMALCLHFKVREKDIKEALLDVRVKGRIELAEVPGEYTLMIDYAHNALALRSLLFTLREYRPSRLVCMFGCGGDRDRNRRFEMGEAAARLSDLVVVTSDNPRFEEPERIMEDIVAGVEKADGAYVVIKDRREAIAYCIGHAQPGDIIVLAGKGHEEYQEICGVKYPMDERKLIGELLAAEAEHERKEPVMPGKKLNMKGKSR